MRAHPHPGGREVEQDPVEAGAVLAAADRVDPHEDAVDREQLSAHRVSDLVAVDHWDCGHPQRHQGVDYGPQSFVRRDAGAPSRLVAAPHHCDSNGARSGRHAVDRNERRGGPVSGSGDRLTRARARAVGVNVHVGVVEMRDRMQQSVAHVFGDRMPIAHWKLSRHRDVEVSHEPVPVPANSRGGDSHDPRRFGGDRLDLPDDRRIDRVHEPVVHLPGRTS